jgi:ribonuclease Z
MSHSVAEVIHDNLRILGASTGGEESWAVIPEMNIGFDIGRAPREVVATDNMFLTHGHMDHSAGIAYYFSQRMFIDAKPGTLYAPAPLLGPIQRLLRIWAEIDGQEPPANLHAAIPGKDILVRRDLLVRPFEVNHSARRYDKSHVHSLGFSAIEVRQKLKDEFQGLDGPQLVALKQKGTEITRRVEIPLVTYCGDTAVGDFLELDYVRNSRVLMLECTFVEPDHIDRARAGNHMHVTDLPDVVRRLNNEKIVLTHLSRRTALADAKAAVRNLLGPTESERIVFLMDCRRRRRHVPAAPNPPHE